jgi:hypothetical protein
MALWANEKGNARWERVVHDDRDVFRLPHVIAVVGHNC